MGPACFGRGSGSLKKPSYKENDTGEHGTNISVFLNQVSLICHGQYLVLTHKLSCTHTDCHKATLVSRVCCFLGFEDYLSAVLNLS